MTSIKWLCGAALAALCSGSPLLAQEREKSTCYITSGAEEGEESLLCFPGDVIIVPGSRTADLALEDFTGSATIITPQQLEQRQTRNIQDVLRDVPGVVVGTVAGQTQLRLRGSEANHVLVLVDGIEVSDPGSGEFDIGTLQAEIGSRIEVLRGPQSALYGNDALAGVIAYDSGEFDGFSAFLEGGTNSTVNGAARWGVDHGDFAASLSTTVVTTDGEPNARPVAGNGVRDIGRDSYNLSGKIEGQVSDTLRLRAVARYVQTEGQANDQDFDFTSPTLGFVIDSPGVGFENEILSGLIGANLETLGGAWAHDLSVQFTDANRQNFNAGGPANANESDRFKASYVSAYEVGEGHSLTFAADYEVEGFNNVSTFNDRKDAENVGFVGEYRYNGDRFDVSAAIRHDVNDLFQDATTFRLGAGVNVTDTTRLRASVGTGVKNPTLSELFGFFDGVFIGNAGLQPEESTSWEIGIDQSFVDNAALLSVTYFNADLENEVFTDFGPPPTFIATPQNRTTESTREGVEVALRANIGPQVSLDATYTYLDSEENGAPEVRRPESTASAAVTWRASDDSGSVTLVVRHNGEMVDTNFGTFTTVTLNDFTLVNLNARYEVSDGLELFARAENLFDESYEQVFSFVSPGRQVVAGFSARF